MHQLQRHFGTEITNLPPQQTLLPRPIKYQTRSSSLYHQDQPSKNDQPAHPNASMQIQKPAFSRKAETTEVDLSATLTEYFDEVMGTMLERESEEMVITNCLWRQGDITEVMRTALLDWLVEVHLKFKMFPQTLFIVVAILDRYLSKKPVTKDQLQLVGTAALFIAAKYEQTYRVPESTELVSISSGTFSKKDILALEADILSVLDFELVYNTSYHFFEPFSKFMDGDQKKISLAHYILQLALMESKFLRYRSSLVAAASIYLVNKVKKAEQAWPDSLAAASGYQEKELRSCARELCHLLEDAQSNKHIKSLKRKFALPRFCEVSKIRLEKKKQKHQ